MNHFYAIYKGDRFLFVGDAIEECAEFLGVKEQTARFINYAAHHDRTGFNITKIFKYEV